MLNCLSKVVKLLSNEIVIDSTETHANTHKNKLFQLGSTFGTSGMSEVFLILLLNPFREENYLRSENVENVNYSDLIYSECKLSQC